VPVPFSVLVPPVLPRSEPVPFIPARSPVGKPFLVPARSPGLLDDSEPLLTELVPPCLGNTPPPAGLGLTCRSLVLPIGRFFVDLGRSCGCGKLLADLGSGLDLVGSGFGVVAIGTGVLSRSGVDVVGVG
jgi:hypothetical protein